MTTMNTPLELISLGDAMVELLERRIKMLSGKMRWGDWCFCPRGMYLVHKRTNYDISLTQMRDSATVLNWIAQIAGKVSSDDRSHWKKEDLAQLVLALDDLLRLQASCCGHGVDKQFVFDSKRALQHARQELAVWKAAVTG